MSLSRNSPKTFRVPPVRSYPAPKAPEELRPLGDEAYHGLAGEIVRAIEPHSEANPAAILIQLLAAVGSAVGRGPGFEVEADRHSCNLYVVVVGRTASARKGSSWGQARRLIEQADPTWSDRIKAGASSGEGLIWEVQDPSEDESAGTDDKRLLIVETELASVLERMTTSGNSLSAVLRQGWDGQKLDTLVKNNRATATGAHIGLIGHITAEELRRKLTATEQANGFANRIIWVYSERSKSLPLGGDLKSVDWHPFIERLSRVLADQRRRILALDPAAEKLWRAVYDDLSEPSSGMLGAVTARAPAQVRRLAVLYAVLDRSKAVKRMHLRAALEVWRYSADSAALLFGTALGDPLADTLLALLRNEPNGLRLTDITNSLGRHRSSEDIRLALASLQQLGLAQPRKESTPGRSAERWFAIGPRQKPKRRVKRKKRKNQVKSQVVV